MSRIQCKFCQFEKIGRCIKKNEKVGTNKRRVCKMYSVDTNRVINYAGKKVEQEKIPTVVRSDSMWNKKLRKQGILDIDTEVLKQFGTTIDKVADPAHPLTGNLDRFKVNSDNDDSQMSTDELS